MSVWLFIIFLMVISSTLIYFKRFVWKRSIKGLTVVQFYYLVVCTPALGVSAISLALEVVKRPAIWPNPMLDNFFLSCFIFTILAAAVGGGIHSTATTVSQNFFQKRTIKAFFINEEFHGPLSHYMIYVGVILSSVLLSLLEYNHPQVYPLSDISLYLFLGVAMGVSVGVGIMWSGYIRPHLILSFIASILLGILYLSVVNRMGYYPLLVMLFTMNGIICTVLASLSLSFKRSSRVELIILKWLFPKGHPLKESLLSR